MSQIQGVNEALYNRLVDNAASSRLYENTVQTDVKKIINQHRRTVKKLAVAKAPKREFARESQRFIREVTSTTKGHLTEYGALQMSFHVSNLHKSIGKVTNVRSPRVNPAIEKIVGPNIQGDRNIEQHFAAIGEKEGARIQSIVNRGQIKGLETQEIAEQVAKTVNISQNQATALVRTAITRTSNATQAEVMKANRDLLKAYQYVAILDSRTSAICSYHDGKVYPITDNKHIPPLHWRCRSTIVPIAKSYAELIKTESRQVKKTVLKNLSKKERDLLDGREIAKEGYGNWLRRQSHDIKLKYFDFDDYKVDLFDKGQLKVDEFFTQTGKSISAQILRRLNNLATRVFTNRRVAAGQEEFPVKASTPDELVKQKDLTDDLRDFYITEATKVNSPLSITDYKGTSLAGKSSSRTRANSGLDPNRTQYVDSITGEVKNSYLYDPDFNVYQERLDFLNNSKILRTREKEYIRDFVASLDDKVSVNQQTAVLENLRLNFERYYDKGRPSYRQPWDNFDAVIKDELKNSVVNVSRILDRRSRTNARQFAELGAKTQEAAVFIEGRWYSFEELNDSYIKDLQFGNEWAQRQGRDLARSAFYGGKAPLRLYFTNPVKKPKKLSKKAEAWFKKQPGGEAALNFIQGKPTASWSDKAAQKIIETLNLDAFKQEFILQDWSLKAAYSRARDKLLSNDYDEPAIQSLSNAFEILAKGESTDYDLLAIQMGKQIYKDHPFEPSIKHHLLGEPSLKTYHKQGSLLLKQLQDRGDIRVLSRGTTRRAVTDAETGRPDGSWRDTVSREVTILNKDLREAQTVNRRLNISRRMGIVDRNKELIITPGEKFYKTRGGFKTNDSVITRRANQYYDKLQINKKLADEINWANKTAWKVDSEYANFMLDVAHFRDPRGRVKKYDELNGVRKVVLQRGDQGVGLLQTVRWHADRGKSFTNPHQIDSRGRIYARGFLTPTGGEFVRPFLNTAQSSSLGEDGWFAMQEQIGSLIGPTQQALTNKGRFQVVDNNHEELIKLGTLIQSTTQRDRRIRETLESPLLTGLDAEEHPKILRLALEYTRITQHVNRIENRDLNTKVDPTTFSMRLALKEYRTSLPIEIDASASGAQIIALSTKNRELAELSNVTATPQKNRLYDLMAQDAISDPRFKNLGRLPSDLTWEDLSKAAKAQNMVAFYGAGPATQAANLSNKLGKSLLARDYIVVTRRKDSNTPKGAFSQLELNKQIDEAIKQAEFTGADDAVLNLQHVKKEINDAIDNDAPIGSKTRLFAKEIHPDVENFVNKVSGANAGIVGPNEFKTISTVMSEHLARRAPITEEFMRFWKDTAETYMTATKSTDIPWVTFDGETMWQRYRPTLEERIEFTDPNTGRKVKNIYRGVAEDAQLKGRASIIDARTGLGVNGNHSNDAAIVRQFHLWGKKQNIPTATIHDAFFVNAGESAKAKSALRKIYADAVDSNNVKKTLDAMLANGLPITDYTRLIKEAKRRGLIPPNELALTRAEILSPLNDGEAWYGIGP